MGVKIILILIEGYLAVAGFNSQYEKRENLTSENDYDLSEEDSLWADQFPEEFVPVLEALKWSHRVEYVRVGVVRCRYHGRLRRREERWKD